MSGMDMMVNALLKATGVNPQEIMAQAQQVLMFAKMKVDEFDQRLQVMERMVQEIHAKTVQPEHVPEQVRQPGDAE